MRVHNASQPGLSGKESLPPRREQTGSLQLGGLVAVARVQFCGSNGQSTSFNLRSSSLSHHFLVGIRFLDLG